MIERLARKAVDTGIRHERICEMQRDIYQYGYTILIEITICSVGAFLIAMLFKKYTDLILFSVCFIPLRCFGGGYHADSTKKCIVLSELMIVLFCILISWEKTASYVVVLLVFVSLGAIVVFLSAPNLRYNDVEIEQRCKNMMRFFYILYLLAAYMLLFSGQKEYSACVALAEMGWLISKLNTLTKTS